MYRHSDIDATVRLFEVLEAETNNWGYDVRSSGQNGNLGSADKLEGGKRDRSYAHGRIPTFMRMDRPDRTDSGMPAV